MRASDPARDALVAALDGVDGFFDVTEAWQLHEAARRRAAAVADPLAVEIGSWAGRSAIAVALGLAAGGSPGRVLAVDPHLHGTRAALESNLAARGLADVVQIVPEYSTDARRRVADGSVDLYFVDGSHEYADVLADIDGWLGALRPGAVVAFNDPGWPGVNRALRHRTTIRGGPFRRPWFCFNTVFFEFEPDAPWTPADERRRLRLTAFLLGKRPLEVLWAAAAPRAPRPVLTVMDLGAWGLTRIGLRTTPYRPEDVVPGQAVQG